MSPVAIFPDARSFLTVMPRAREPRRQRLVVYTINVSSIPSQLFGRETFARREDAERFIEEVRRDDPEHARHLRIEELELDAGGPN